MTKKKKTKQMEFTVLEGSQITECCDEASYVTVYLGWFRFMMCRHCYTLICEMKPVLEWIFMHFVAYIYKFRKLYIPDYIA